MLNSKEKIKILKDKLSYEKSTFFLQVIEEIEKDLDRLEELVKLIEILDWYRIMMPYKTFDDILKYGNNRVFINNVFNKEWYRRKNIKEELEDDK